MSSLFLGVIADDFTGATDIASMLVAGGLRCVQSIGVPQALPDADALVVALKSRTAPVEQAVAESLQALAFLRQAGARRFVFKVCSTFDSTPRGNIGPVAEALMDALGAGFAPVCPAFPANGRTVYRGHLFVGDQLLSESGMREHPLTPMTDANLVRVLQAQSRGRVGLLGYDAVARGEAALRERMAELRRQGVAMAIADAVDEAGLRTLASATAELPLWVAGSGVAPGLCAAWAARGDVTLSAQAAALPPVQGRAAVLAGSCSQATNAQVAAWRSAGRPALAVDARSLARGEPVADQALAWAREALAEGPVLLHASLPAAELRAVQAELGAEHAGALVESALAAIARGLVREAGVRRLVVAGGETSGAVVQALGLKLLRIGATICPGVPWTRAELPEGGEALALALKSGNFGGPAFFAEALAMEDAGR